MYVLGEYLAQRLDVDIQGLSGYGLRCDVVSIIMSCIRVDYTVTDEPACIFFSSDDCDEKAVVQFCKDCYSGKMDNVQRALESGIDPNSQTHVMGDYPLHRACLGLQDNPNVTNELVCWGARVDSVVRNDGNTPLHYAATNNNKKCVEILTKHRCKTGNFNISLCTVLMQ